MSRRWLNEKWEIALAGPAHLANGMGSSGWLFEPLPVAQYPAGRHSAVNPDSAEWAVTEAHRFVDAVRLLLVGRDKV